MTKVKCSMFKNFTVKEITIAQEGLRRLEEAINDNEFKSMILNAQFGGTKDSNSEILQKIESGADELDPRKDYEINFDCRMYYSWWSRVVGYVVSGSRTIHVNRKYFGLPNDFSSNCLHELCHLIGYTHSSARDFGSVPYRMNELFSKWCTKKGYI